MLQIRQSQRDVFRSKARERFEREMALHLTQRSPFHARVLGDPGMLAAVRFGIERAGRRGFTLRGPVRLWLELMFLFGGRFDEDPLLPAQTARLLDCRDPDRQMQTAERMHAIACDLLARISGPDNAYNRAALAQVERLAADPAPLPRDGLEDRLLADFVATHPQKVEVLGESAHRRLIAQTLEQARRLGVTSTRGLALFPVLAFIVGAGFADDPLYPWISRTLTDPRRPDPDQRAARLERRSRTYLRHVVANLGIA